MFLRNQGLFETFSQTVRALEDGVVLTDYNTYNTVEMCADRSRLRLAIIDGAGLFDTTGRSRLDVQIAQARLGGTPTADLGRSEYLRRLAAHKVELSSALERFAGPSENVYYICPFGRQFLFPEELQLFEKYHYFRFLQPSVFWFRGKLIANSNATAPGGSPDRRTAASGLPQGPPAGDGPEGEAKRGGPALDHHRTSF